MGALRLSGITWNWRQEAAKSDEEINEGSSLDCGGLVDNSSRDDQLHRCDRGHDGSSTVYGSTPDGEGGLPVGGSGGARVIERGEARSTRGGGYIQLERYSERGHEWHTGSEVHARDWCLRCSNFS